MVDVPGHDHFPNSYVGLVCDVDVALGIDSDARWASKRRGGCWPAVADSSHGTERSVYPRPSDRCENPGRADHPDLVLGSVCDVDVSVAVDCDHECLAKCREERGCAIA